MVREVIRPTVEQLVKNAMNEERKAKRGDLSSINATKPKRPKAEIIEMHTKKIRELFTNH